MSPLIFYPCLAASFIVGCWLAWNYLPTGKLHGRTLVLKEWWRFRLNRKLERGDVQLKSAMELPVTERLPTLLALHDKLGSEWMTGDNIRLKVIATGQDGAIPFMEACLKDSGVRFSTVVFGVKEAIVSGVAQDHYKVRAFQLLSPYLDQRNETNPPGGSDSIPELLLQMDREWAVKLLKAPDCLAKENRLFTAIMRALNGHGIVLPRKMLESWLNLNDLAALSYSEKMAQLELAAAMLSHCETEGRRLLWILVNSKEEGLSEYAVQAWLAWRGLPDPR
ncbi:hypothetical protein FEM03_15230 [Phragmitibacter flavus]|uniref:Uncharacterized protein n=1 Tax=Phragmitibacter flavus TaxID=2576071 RepID=A0A5R8KEQ8_9BACT|nr:hypothetical protein [Phragmitibacter flavus]TLD70079.1 hypothetical protein FEM03_15230 [Phragmitibacter flavus]